MLRFTTESSNITINPIKSWKHEILCTTKTKANHTISMFPLGKEQHNDMFDSL